MEAAARPQGQGQSRRPRAEDIFLSASARPPRRGGCKGRGSTGQAAGPAGAGGARRAGRCRDSDSSGGPAPRRPRPRPARPHPRPRRPAPRADARRRRGPSGGRGAAGSAPRLRLQLGPAPGAPLLEEEEEEEEEEGGGRRSCGKAGRARQSRRRWARKRSGRPPGERLRSRVGGWVRARLPAPSPRGPGEPAAAVPLLLRPAGRLRRGGGRGGRAAGSGEGPGGLRPCAPPRVRGRGPGRRGAASGKPGRGGPRPASAARRPDPSASRPPRAPGPGRRLCCPQSAGERPGLGKAWGGGAGPARSAAPRPRSDPRAGGRRPQGGLGAAGRARAVPGGSRRAETLVCSARGGAAGPSRARAGVGTGDVKPPPRRALIFSLLQVLTTSGTPLWFILGQNY